MTEDVREANPQANDPHPAESAPIAAGHSRRELVRGGIKLAFVAPVIATFFAADAKAAGSGLTCRSPGHTCVDDDDCCGTDFCNVSDQCEAL